MNRTLKLLGLGILMASTMTLTSCKKEGCTNQDATNFDSEADEDNGSCKYEGKVVTWWPKATTTVWQNRSAKSIKIYLDGVLTHNESVSLFWTGAPDCGQSGAFTKSFDMGNNKTKSVSYMGVISFDNGTPDFTEWSGTINLEANTCYALEFGP